MRLRRTQRARGLRGFARGSSILLASAMLLISVAGLGISVGFAEMQRGLPAVDALQSIFEISGEEPIAPTRFYERTGEVVILEMLHPLASERAWFSLESGSRPGASSSFIEAATIAAQDPTFWTNPGYEFGQLMRSMTNAEEDEGWREVLSIAEYLAQHLLQPAQDAYIPNRDQAIRDLLLASRITAAYSKEQILEWFLNSAFYGNLAYGIDAAALVYFGVHASELSLAQAAMLAPIVMNPELNPADAPQEARARQEATLAEMVRLGFIDEGDQEAALVEDFNSRNPQEIHAGLETSGFNAFAWKQLLAILGPRFAHRPGLQVLTSLDLSLQLQVDCALRSYLARMSGGNPAYVYPAQDGSDCEAAVLLPPLRPGDVGLQHRIEEAAAVVIDPFSGEMLSLADTRGALAVSGMGSITADQGHAMGSALYPFIYLTAFSRGFAPGTMVLDLPNESQVLAGGDPLAEDMDWHMYSGPVRMRKALVGLFDAAAQRTLDLVGRDNTQRTMQQMGLGSAAPAGLDSRTGLASGDSETNLIDLTFAHALIANNGSMVGIDISGGDQEGIPGDLDPIGILRIDDALGNDLFNVDPSIRVVLSPQLAYLMVDVLSDDTVRWDLYGQSNPLEVGRPAGAALGMAPNSNWTVGFTPSRAVGVWLGNSEEDMVGIGELNGAAPLWHAIMRYSTSDLPLQGWSLPPGVSEMDVCDPSGLLPTIYCPSVVREVFIHGTEPTSYDHLYRPFRVNSETGNLATLFTPLDLVEERVYLFPPPEAWEWARQVGFEQPPQEYDSIYVQPEIDPAVNIRSLDPFAYVAGELSIEGNAHSEGFAYYRLQFGAGINPTRWIQIGEDVDEEVEDGVLGMWDTEGLSGLYTLQLVVVREGDRVATAAIPLTIDNQPPLVRVVSPQVGQEYSLSQDVEIDIKLEASDDTGLAQVALYLDGRRIRIFDAPPYSMTWTISGIRNHTLFVRAYDLAGNLAESGSVEFEVDP